MTRSQAAVGTLTAGLVVTPAGVYLWMGAGPALVAAGILLLVAAVLLGWDA